MHPEAGAYAAVWPWEPLAPSDVRELLAGLSAPWWVTGGWGVDLFLGRVTRRHLDIDIALLRRDQLELRRHLAGWDLYYATPERALAPWDGRFLEPPVRRLWFRREPGSPWCCDVHLEEASDKRWVYRNDARVSRPLDEIGLLEGDGVPLLAPEISLLYMLSLPTPKSKATFLAANGSLGPPRRRWLREALETAHRDHPVLPLLQYPTRRHSPD